jgi:hypothetical protein
VTKKLPGRGASVFGAIVVIIMVALAARSCSPSRSVGHAAVEEACFYFSRAIRIPNSATTHAEVAHARAVAARSQDRTLAADLSRVSGMYPGKGTGVSLSHQVLTDTLAECKAQGWKVTDPCTYGAAVCGRTGVTTVTS